MSGITYRHQYQKKIIEINNFLNARQYISEYAFIDNDNIGTWELWKDKLHLNDQGTIKLVNNFIDSINGESYL